MINHLVDTIREVEQTARLLELDREQRRASHEAVNGYCEDFLSSLDQLPAFSENPDQAAGLADLAIGEAPKDIYTLTRVLREYVDGQGVNGASGGHMAYIPISALYHAALGDFLAAVTNRYASLFFACPGGVRMEHQLLRWMADLLGMPAEAGGNLTSSGSTAHLIGMVTARETQAIRARDVENTVVYYSAETHHCVEKALRVAGLGETVKRAIPIDACFKAIPGELSRLIAADREQGLRPWMVIANAGATNTGVVDPLAEMADICERFGLWFHVDAAYGGFFALCDEKRGLLAGIERADTVVLDPHKGMFIPAGLGALVARNQELVAKAHAFEANYLADARPEGVPLSPSELSPELTKHFRALRLWLPLHFHGLAPFRAALREKLLLARYIHARLDAMPDWEVGPAPDLSVVIFRYHPQTGDRDVCNRALREAMLKDGRIFMSTTLLNGEVWLRLVPLSYRTHLETVDLAIDLLARHAQDWRGC